MNGLIVAHVEHSARLIERVADACRAAGVAGDPLPLDSMDALSRALDDRVFDLIIIGHAPPSIVAPEVVTFVRDRQPDTSCLVVLDGRDIALDAAVMAAGAAECTTAEYPARLARDIRRVLDHAEDQAQRERLVIEAASLEAQFQHAQRLAAVGELAGGLAHDFNNLLTIINGSAEQLLRQVGPHHDLRPLVEPIWKAGSSGAQLTKRLLVFGRPSPGVSSGVDLNAVVGDIQPMLARLLGESIRLVLDLAADLRPVRVDPAEIAQVIINLATNARDAMPGGGTLTIVTANAATTSQPCVDVIVSDTGLGMDDAVRSRLFEPFFSTKPPGFGTGLGLASVRAIIDAHGGAIDVETGVGRGTAMRVRLPGDDGGDARIPDGADDEPDAPAAGGVVLLVEDDAGVREIIARFLRSGGYEVLEAANAVEAEALVRSGHRLPALLVSDVVLPGDSGPRLAETLATLVPGLKTLFISGYPAEAIAQFGPESGLTFLVKPFSRATLLRRLRETIHSAGADAD